MSRQIFVLAATRASYITSTLSQRDKKKIQRKEREIRKREQVKEQKQKKKRERVRPLGGGGEQ